MLKSIKESGDYLGQISNNISEKVEILEQEIESRNLPKSPDGKIRIVELGTGGGESLRRINEKAKFDNNIDIIALDIMPSLVSSLKKEIGTEAVAADAGELPFRDNSISAINASAILHEISSYGTGLNEVGNIVSNKIYGTAAVTKALAEFNRVLTPEGIVAYRDVLAPNGDIKKNKTVEYFHRSWKMFADWFLEDFVKSNPHFYDKDDLVFITTNEGFKLKTAAGMHREFQRHYLMLRDYLRNVKKNEFGITILRSDWLNEKEGLKSVVFSIDDRLLKMVDLSKYETHVSSTGVLYKGNSDDFDKTYDDLIVYYFEQINKLTADGVIFKQLIEVWKEREGMEHYIYGNIADLLKLVSQQTDSSGFILFPESDKSMVVSPRYYYNRYLNQVINNPEFDGKQIIALKKMPKKQALISLKSFINSEFSSFILDPFVKQELELLLE